MTKNPILGVIFSDDESKNSEENEKIWFINNNIDSLEYVNYNHHYYKVVRFPIEENELLCKFATGIDIEIGVQILYDSRYVDKINNQIKDILIVKYGFRDIVNLIIKYMCGWNICSNLLENKRLEYKNIEFSSKEAYDSFSKYLYE